MAEAMTRLTARLQRANRYRSDGENANPTLENVLDMLDLHLRSSDIYSEVARNLLEYFTEGRFPEELIAPCQELLAEHMPSGREIIESTSDAIENIAHPHAIDHRHLSALREDLTATITAHFS